MANTTRATAARRLKFTPALLADVRQRFEHTDEQLTTMAADLGCCAETVRNIGKREGWVRYQAPPRDLIPAAQLLAKAEKLAGQSDAALSLPPCGGGLGRGVAASEQSDCRSTTTPTPNPSPQEPATGRAAPAARPGGGGEKEEAPPGGGKERETAEALHAEVLKQLAEFKAERAQLKGQPLGFLERERAARTLAGLTATLHRLQTLRCGVPLSGSHNDHAYDDMPADLDAFRDALARRIDAFVASRMDAGDAAPAAADPADEAGA